MEMQQTGYVISSNGGDLPALKFRLGALRVMKLQNNIEFKFLPIFVETPDGRRVPFVIHTPCLETNGVFAFDEQGGQQAERKNRRSICIDGATAPWIPYFIHALNEQVFSALKAKTNDLDLAAKASHIYRALSNPATTSTTFFRAYFEKEGPMWLKMDPKCRIFDAATQAPFPEDYNPRGGRYMLRIRVPYISFVKTEGAEAQLSFVCEQVLCHEISPRYLEQLVLDVNQMMAVEDTPLFVAQHPPPQQQPTTSQSGALIKDARYSLAGPSHQPAVEEVSDEEGDLDINALVSQFLGQPQPAVPQTPTLPEGGSRKRKKKI